MRTFLRSYRGTHPLGCSALPCFAAESTREGTLMSLPEGAPARSDSAWCAEGRCRPKVTSGCPKRSEGGCPCRNEDEHRPSSRIPIEKQAACHPHQRGEDKHRPPLPPPPAHSRLVFKLSSLKGKQRRAPEQADKYAAYISRGSAHLCVDRTPYEPSPGLYSR